MFKLVIQDDEGKTTEVPLIRDEITIGRKEGNTIRLTERNVSRRHARILRNNGEVHIEDLGSYNGIRVNNARIAERVSLRVSDQVQIGDYKLYLKTQGEQAADDSHTVPHDRVESNGVSAHAPVDAIAATPPVAAPHPVLAAPTAPPMVGSPNHTLVALNDADPTVRSVGPATAAAVAAMNATGGYGKLVVLSSNFAGKEFELSRPQMIIGRTDENDIVINHRSISRNHAKLTREPETGRYTISDLQSSNGVRVNGQDYGKVELRRGDVVDLGHVRLRFVEAGEDFVFARDAVITDVPEAGGGRRGIVMALIAAILVVAAGVVVYMMRGPEKTTGGQAGSAGSAAPATPDATPDEVAHNGSAETAPETAAVTPKTDDDKGRKLAQCADYNAQRKWQDLLNCAAELETLGAKDKGKELRARATQETANETLDAKARDAIRDGSLVKAQALLKQMGQESVYSKSLGDVFRTADEAAADEARKRTNAFVAAHDCTGLKRYAQQVTAGANGTERVLGVVKEANGKCEKPDVVATHRPTPGTTPSNPGTQAGSATAAPGNGKCDNVDDLIQQAASQYSNGFSGMALNVMTKALACRQEIRMFRLAAMYACASHDIAAARLYFNKLPPTMQAPIEQRCQQESLNVRGP